MSGAAGAVGNATTGNRVRFGVKTDYTVNHDTGMRYRVTWVDPRTAQVHRRHMTGGEWVRVTDPEEVEWVRRQIAS